MDEKTVSPAVKAALDKLDSKFGIEVIDWLAGLYDKKSGGFYYAESSRDNEQFEPDIESLVQAILLLDRMGLITRDENRRLITPEAFKEAALKFLSERQDESDGYFYDPIYREIAGTEKKDRNTTFASWIFKGYGVKTPYPLPGERMAKSAETPKEKKSAGLYERFASEENFLSWLEEISAPPRSSYAWGSDLASGSDYIIASGMRPTLVKWLKERQCPETGMWTSEATPNGINGVLKICGFFCEETEPFPNADVFLKNAVEISKTFSPRTGSEAWNPLGAMVQIIRSLGNNLTPELKELIDSSIAEIISNISDKVEVFRMPDGGYGYLMSGSSNISNGVVVSTGAREGDVNGMSLIALIYQDAYALAGLKHPRLWEKYNEYFFKKIGY